VRRALPVSSVDTVANIMSVGSHGCTAGDPVEFRLEPGGALPSPLSLSAVYYALPVVDSDDLLQVSAAPNGSAVALTTTGSAFDLVPSIRPIVRSAIRTVSRWIDQHTPENATPLVADENGLYPDIVRQMAAVLACEWTLAILGQASTQVTTAAERMRTDADLMLKGLPLPDPEQMVTPTDLAASACGTFNEDRIL
jgi:hypothetical protein